jgi:hypothetical protein
LAFNPNILKNFKKIRLYSTLLLVIYLAGALRVVFPYISYELNYEYISTVLCINKEKPKLKCNGKCHLSKEIQKATEEESKSKTTQSKGFEITEYSPETSPFAFTIDFIELENNRFILSNKILSLSLDKSTPPPKV